MFAAMLTAAQDAGTLTEAASYAAREAASPDLQGFTGGSTLGVLVTVGVIVLIVVLIWWLLNRA